MANLASAGWVALMAWESNDVGSTRTILWSPDAPSHVRAVSQELAQGLRVLVEEYTEDVNLGELENLHERYGVGPYPQEGWSFSEVLSLLERLPALAAEEYASGGNPTIKTCGWYCNLVEYLNDLFPDGNGAWVMAEGPIPDGLEATRYAVASWFPQGPRPDDPLMAWLGQWAVLCRQCWTPPLPPGRSSTLHQLINEFNDLNAFV